MRGAVRAAFLICLATASPLIFLATASPAGALPIEKLTSPGGITAWISLDPSASDVVIVAGWRGGAYSDPERGISGQAARVMNEGSGDMDAVAFKIAIQDLGARMGVSAGGETIGASLSTPKAKLDAAAALFGQMINHPRFDARSVERDRKLIKASIADIVREPQFMAEYAMDATQFPDQAIFKALPTLDYTPPRQSHDELVAWYRNHLARNNLIVSVTGAIPREDIGPLLDKLFGGLPAESHVPPAPPLSFQGADETALVEREGDQTTILFGGAYLPDGGPKEGVVDAAGDMLIDIIGGVSGKLFTKIREERGLAYGVGMGVRASAIGSYYRISADIPNKHATEVLSLIREVLADIVAKGVTAEDIASARERMKAQHGRRLTSASAIAGLLQSLQTNNHPIGHFNQYPEILDQVTLDQVNSLASRYLDPKAATAALAGNPDGLIPTRRIEIE